MAGRSASAPQLVVALDNCSAAEARGLAQALGAAGVRWFKVGLELYTREGPALLRELKQLGHRVFLDLKLHDIPNTVANAVKASAAGGADLLTIHASGGPDMLAAAAAAASGTSLSVVAVTVLTSLGPEDFASVCLAWGAREGAQVPRGTVVLQLATFAAEAGLRGIVCPASELRDGQVARLNWRDSRPVFVTPGIRGEGDARNDQRAVASVEQAVLAGSTHLVVGRPITSPANGSPADAARGFLARIKEAHGVPHHT